MLGNIWEETEEYYSSREYTTLLKHEILQQFYTLYRVFALLNDYEILYNGRGKT